jgi:hypothetical protein
VRTQTRPDEPMTMSPAQARFVSWVSSVLVDIVVLNLFVEFVHTIVIDSFSISILTAVLLKLMVDAVKGLEQAVSAYLAARSGAIWKAVRFVAVWLILFVSKFVILEAVNVVFGDHVELGSFIEIVAIIVTMLAANAILLSIYRRLGAVQA